MHYNIIRLIGILVVIWLDHSTEAASILALFQINGRSHYMMFEALLKQLVNKGHEVDVLSHFPQKSPMPNFYDINVEGTAPNLENNLTFSMMTNLNAFAFVNVFWQIHHDICKQVLESDEVQTLLKSEKKYDLIILEIFTTDCLLGIVHKHKVPYIIISSTYPMHWGYERMGNPDNPSFMPSYFLGLSDKMTFKQRLVNTVVNFLTSVINSYYTRKASHEIGLKYFGEDMPSYSELARNASLYLVNSYSTLNFPRPYTPGIIDVGGLHIERPKKLSEDFEKFLNESEHGVIYISLGSMMRPDSLPKEMLDAIIGAISEFPQRVLWKDGGDIPIPGLTHKFKTSKWIPQNDILHHPKIRAFFTHGGMMSTMEAVNAGVPMIIMPLFADQFQNAVSYESKGAAIRLDYSTITKGRVRDALRAVLNNSSYGENAKRLSRLFRDRPQSPMATAVYWVEYVIRHRGALHLKSAAGNLPLYQYLLLDVICFIVAVILFIGAVMWYGIIKTLSLLISKRYKLKKH